MDEVLACWLLDKSLEGPPPGLLPPSDSDDEMEFPSRRKNRTKINLQAAEHQAKTLEEWDKRDDFDKLYEVQFYLAKFISFRLKICGILSNQRRRL